MADQLPLDIDDEKIAPVRGNLLNRMIHAILENRWTTGYGLLSTKGAAGGIISIDPNILPDPAGVPYWRGKVTANTEVVDGTPVPSEKHQIREVDANDDVISESDGRRETNIARAINKRKGVPIGTICIVFEHPGPDPDAESSDSETTHYRFTPWDGLDYSPKDMTIDTSEPDDAMTDEPYATTWDVEEQESGEDGVKRKSARVFLEPDIFSVFGRDITYDASGMQILVDEEIRGGLVGDAGLTSLDGHITLRPYAGGPDDKLKVAINEPQASHRDLVFTSDDTSVTIKVDTVASSEARVEFDDSGRALIANGADDVTIDLSVTGGGGGLPSGTSGQILVHNGAAWVAQDTVTEDVFTAATIDGSDDLVFTRKTVTIIATAAAANATVAGEECP